VLSFVLFLFDLCKPKKAGVTMNTEEIVEYLIKIDDEDSEDKQGLKMRLASTLCASSEDLSKIITTKENLLNSFIDIDSNDLSIWKFKARFWYNCAQESSMKKFLAEKGVAQKVFANFRKHFGPEIEDTTSDQELNQIIVSFISTVTTGNEEIEKEIAKVLKVDLTTSCKNDRLDYLNSIVVPLLHSENTIPVTLYVGDKEGEKMIYHPIYHKPKDTTSENKFFFKSSILSKSQETAMMRMFKEHVHEYHDNYDRLVQKKWTLIASDDVPKKGDFQKISDKISEKSNTLHLVKCTINGEQAVFGGFCAAAFPSLVGLQSDFNYELPHDDANFVFYYKGDMENHFVMTNNKPFGYIYTDYELGGVISISGDFVLCSWSINYSHTAGNIYNMKCVEQPGFNSFYNNIQVERYECWHVDLDNPVLSNLNSEKSAYFGIPFYKSLSPFNLLTDNVVFHISKKMPIKVLSCELFGKKIPLRIKNTEKEIDSQKTVGEVVDEDKEGFSQNIFEFGYDRPGKDDEISKEDEKETEKTLNEYEAKFCILEQFDGAEELVQACQKAIQGWSNKELREAWDQWLKEVMSFISFPGFFTRLTSDRKNSTLFFDILSGIPEKDTKEALKKREKEIEKKKQYMYNYKAPEFENEWIDKQLEMVKLTYNVVQKIFDEDTDSEDLREKCLQNGMINTFIERIGILTCETARTKVEEKDYDSDSEEEIKTEAKKKKRDKNRKGVGYTTDVGQEWNVNSYLKKKESKNSQISDIIGILKGIIKSEELSIKYCLKELILESALLPVLENAFRSGSILEMAKEYELFNSYLDFITTICKNKTLTIILMEIGKEYEPNQLEPVYKLLDKLTGLAEIFLRALSTEKDHSKDSEESKHSKELAEKIKTTNEIVQLTVAAAMNKDVESIADILNLPLQEKYRKLISPLRFGYMDMKSSPTSSSYTHYYSYNISQDTTIENSKIVRLAQEIADLSNSLPNEHTNAIFVRVDETRVDIMKAIICGASSTPYAHGCFEFDLYFDSRYPQTPPKCQLVTTGSGAVRFNPNLYADGKVCLSLLGTWRGSSTENWDAKFSTILQVLMSIQAIIMSEEVYYNEPGYEHEAGTTEGEAKNEAYSNIVRY
jgi:ubiquitin-protein ligase